MKKILAVLLALSMLFAFAACGGGNEEPTTTAPTTESTTAEDIFGAGDDTSTDAATDASTPDASAPDASNADASTEAADSTAASSEAAAALTKAEFVKLYNAETAKIAKNGSYHFKRTCSYINPIDVGNSTDTLNSIIKGIDENSSLDTVVGGFLGIGTKEGNYPTDDLKDDYQIMATTLKESDLTSFSEKDGVYTFTVAKVTDPKKTAATPFARLTNDFITHEEVVEGLDETAGGLIKAEKTTVNYKNIKAMVKVVDGKITTIQYSYEFDAVLKIKITLASIDGTGSAQTVAQFTNIKY